MVNVLIPARLIGSSDAGDRSLCMLLIDSSKRFTQVL